MIGFHWFQCLILLLAYLLSFTLMLSFNSYSQSWWWTLLSNVQNHLTFHWEDFGIEHPVCSMDPNVATHAISITGSLAMIICLQHFTWSYNILSIDVSKFSLQNLFVLYAMFFNPFSWPIPMSKIYNLVVFSLYKLQINFHMEPIHVWERKSLLYCLLRERRYYVSIDYKTFISLLEQFHHALFVDNVFWFPCKILAIFEHSFSLRSVSNSDKLTWFRDTYEKTRVHSFAKFILNFNMDGSNVDRNAF